MLICVLCLAVGVSGARFHGRGWILVRLCAGSTGVHDTPHGATGSKQVDAVSGRLVAADQFPT